MVWSSGSAAITRVRSSYSVRARSVCALLARATAGAEGRALPSSTFATGTGRCTASRCRGAASRRARAPRVGDGGPPRPARACCRGRRRRRRRSCDIGAAGRGRGAPARRGSAQSPRARPAAAELDHVRRHVAPVDVMTGSKPGHQQSAGTAAGIERRLIASHELSEAARSSGPPTLNSAHHSAIRP